MNLDSTRDHQQLFRKPMPVGKDASGLVLDRTGRDLDVVHIGERSGLAYARLRSEWAEELEVLEHASYPTADHDDLYDVQNFRVLARDFSEGCFVGFDGDELVAMGIGLRIDFDFEHPQHRVTDIVPHDPDLSGHVPDGQWYYGSGIATRAEYRKRGIGAELYHLRKEACRALNLRGIVAGGVIPGYAEHKHRLSADAYIDEVRAGRLYDPTLSFQLENGFEAVCGLENYIDDPAVDGWATLIVWRNPGYRPGEVRR